MDKQDKIDLILGLTLIVAGASVALISSYHFKLKMRRLSKEWEAEFMQKGWEDIQKLKFFADASDEDKIKYYNTYWNTDTED